MITVVILTWPNHPTRWKYFNNCVPKAFSLMTASRHEIQWKCVTETEVDPLHSWYGQHIEKFCSSRGIPLIEKRTPADLGAAMNFAARQSNSKYTVILQDDFLIKHLVDLSPGIELMEEFPSVDLIRYSWPGHLVSFKEPFHGWKQINEQGDWPYGDDPHLRRDNFSDKFGYYHEYERHGASESYMAHSLQTKKATILATDEPCFGHFGNMPSVINDWRKDRPKR